MNLSRKKYVWNKIYSYTLPSIFVSMYMVYLYARLYANPDLPLIQNSSNFEGMLESLVVFMSIILSVFGFLIPSFLGSKGESRAIKYFIKYADMKVFAAKLKNIVAIGLIDIFFTCILFLKDIFSDYITNIIVCIWLWFLFFFMCNSYRFISIMINLLLAEKEEFVQKAANEVSQEEKENLDNTINHI